MAKCPKCLQRKGKRSCPALATEICSQCCAEHRLDTIACPQDCPHLASEYYQQGRRRARAASQGRRFVETINEAFSTEPRREFAFALQADLYYYMREQRPLDDETIVKVLESLQQQDGPVIVAEPSPHPLVPYLKERMSSAKPYALLEDKLSTDDRSACFDILIRHVRSASSSADRHRYRKELADFFSALDFEADLDYDPSRDEGPKRSGGGVILPG